MLLLFLHVEYCHPFLMYGLLAELATPNFLISLLLNSLYNELRYTVDSHDSACMAIAKRGNGTVWCFTAINVAKSA